MRLLKAFEAFKLHRRRRQGSIACVVTVMTDDLIYKTHSPTPQPQQGYTMAPHLQDAWNAWADAKIANANSALHSETGEALDAIVNKIDQVTGDLEKALLREREKNAKLRSDVEVLRVMIRSQNAGVTRSKRDVT